MKPPNFMFDLPVFIVAINPRYGSDGQWILGRKDVVLGEQTPERNILPIFTDDDLALRFSDAYGVDGHPIAFDMAAGLIQTVRRLVHFHSVTHIALDPTMGEKKRLSVPVDEFLESVQDAIDRPE